MLRKLFVAVVLLTAGFVGGLVLTARLRPVSESRAEAAPAPAPTAASPAEQARATVPVPGATISTAGPDFTRIAGQAVKGVANISSLQVVRTPNSPFANDPFFRYFFGEGGDDAFGSRDRRSLSLGSGVVISADGYVVTNNHVVGENMREITVALPDKREVRGRLIGTDPATDIALLKLNVTGIPVVPWGDSSCSRPSCSATMYLIAATTSSMVSVCWSKASTRPSFLLILYRPTLARSYRFGLK